MEAVSLSADVSNYKHRAACRRLRRRFLPNEWIWNLSFFVLLMAGYIAPIYLNRTYETNAYNGLGLIVVISFFGFIGRALWRNRNIWRAVRRAPFRSAKWEYELDSKGVRIRSPGMDHFYSWSLIVDVVEGGDGLLLLTSDFEYIPIPSSAATGSVDLKQLKTQIGAWIDAEKAPATG